MFQGAKCRRTAGEVLGDHADVHSMKTLLTRREHSSSFLFNVQVGPGNHSSKSNSILNLRSQSLQNCLVRKHVNTHNYSQIKHIYIYIYIYSYVYSSYQSHTLYHFTYDTHSIKRGIKWTYQNSNFSNILATYLSEYQQNSAICAMHLLDLLLH